MDEIVILELPAPSIFVYSHTHGHMAARSEPLMLYSTKRICAAIWTAVLLALLSYSETASELISHVLSLLLASNESCSVTLLVSDGGMAASVPPPQWPRERAMYFTLAGSFTPAVVSHHAYLDLCSHTPFLRV